MEKIFKKSVYIAIAVIIFLVLSFTMNMGVSGSDTPSWEDWHIESSSESGTISLPQIRDVKYSDIYTYSISFPRPELNSPALVLIRPLSHAFEIHLNGHLVKTVSELERPTANLWNYSFTIPLTEYIEDENNLSIVSAAHYLTGFPTEPFLMEYSESVTKINRLNFFLNDTLMFSIGASFILGIILLLFSLSRKTAPDAAFYMGIATIASAIYCLDYQFRLSGGSFVFFMFQKKLFLICGYIGAGAFLHAISKYSNTGEKIRKPVSILTTAACTGILVAWNYPVMVTIFKFTNTILIINLLLGLFILLKMVPEKSSFLIPICLLLLSIIQATIDSILKLDEPLPLQFILLVTVIFFSIHIMLDFNQLFKEYNKLAIGIHQDPLTGVFNRRYLKKMLPQHWDHIVMVDIDNFKYYNDTYGHGKGDQLLLLFVEIVQENLRTNDLLMRFGGDEFIIFLADVDTSQSDKIMKRIEQQFRDRNDDRKIDFSYGIEALDKNIDKAIASADALMYDMKKSRKR